MSDAALAPGIYPGIAFQDYLAIDAVNNSTLTMFRRTPAHAHYEMTHPEEVTSALRTGDAAHVAILDPERFKTEYVRAPKFDMRTNAGKASAAKWEIDHPDQAALLPAEWDMADAMRDSVWSHPLAVELLSGKGQNEMTAVWKDDKTGLLCKARMDRFTSYQNWTTILDLKTARDASYRGFAKSSYEFQYHWQAAFYVDGLNILAPHKRRFIHLVVEKQPPYLVAIYEMDEPTLREGRAQYRQAFDMLAECQITGNWPGYPVGIEALDLPKWGFEIVDPTS